MPLESDGTRRLDKLKERRRRRARGKLPTRSTPDVGPIDIPGPQVHESNCARYGGCSAWDAAYGNNMSMFKWTMEARVNSSYTGTRSHSVLSAFSIEHE